MNPSSKTKWGYRPAKGDKHPQHHRDIKAYEHLHKDHHRSHRKIHDEETPYEYSHKHKKHDHPKFEREYRDYYEYARAPEPLDIK